MLGLILKDFYTTVKRSRVMIIVLFIFICFGMSSTKNISFAAGYLMIMLSVMPLTSFSYDVATKWDTYAVCMPISRKKIVLSKYLFLLLCLAVGTVFLFVLTGIGVTIFHSEFNLQEALWSILLVGFIGFSISMIMLPMAYKFGPEKSRYVLLAIFIIAISSFSILKYIFGNILAPNISWVLNYLNFVPIILLLVSVVLFLISFEVSANIYKHKDL